MLVYCTVGRQGERIVVFLNTREHNTNDRNICTVNRNKHNKTPHLSPQHQQQQQTTTTTSIISNISSRMRGSINTKPITATCHTAVQQDTLFCPISHEILLHRTSISKTTFSLHSIVDCYHAGRVMCRRDGSSVSPVLLF